MYKSYLKFSVGFWFLLFLFGATSVLFHPIYEMVNLIRIYLFSNLEDASIKLLDKQFTSIKNVKSEQEETLRRVKSKFFEPEKFGQVYQILNKISAKNNINIKKLHPEVSKSDSLFSIFPVRIGFVAEFHQILKFLAAIESELPGCQITFLKMENHTLKREKLEVELIFEIYILR